VPNDQLDPPPETDDGFRDFDEYYRADSKRVILFVKRLGATWQEAEDVSQVAMTAVYKKWPGICSENPRGYARKVAEREFWNSAADASKERKKLLEADWTRPRAYVMDDVLLRRDTELTFWALERLRFEQRRAFAWHLDGFSNKEIADLIGGSESTVRSNIRHARNKLKTLLSQHRKDTSSAGRRPDDERKGR